VTGRPEPATTWGAGDYPLMAERLEPAAAAAVDLAQVGSHDRVLDVACGTGNGAVLASRRGARVTGVDLEPALLEVARRRAPEVEWLCADAAALPAGDGAHGLRLETLSRATLELAFADVAEARRFLVRTAGHVLAAEPHLRREGRWEALQADLEALIAARARPAGDGIALELGYVLARARA